MGEKMGRNPPWRELRPGLSSSARSTPCAPASSLEAPAATQPPCTYLKYHHDHYYHHCHQTDGRFFYLCSARITILVTGLLVWRLPPLAVDLRLPMCHDHNWYHFDHYCNNDDDTCAKAKGWNLSVKNHDVGDCCRRRISLKVILTFQEAFLRCSVWDQE